MIGLSVVVDPFALTFSYPLQGHGVVVYVSDVIIFLGTSIFYFTVENGTMLSKFIGAFSCFDVRGFCD